MKGRFFHASQKERRNRMARKKDKIAPKEEVLEMFTAIMRGEISDCVTRKTGGVEEAVTIPPKLSERAHAAELLSRHYGLFSDKAERGTEKPEIAGEIEAYARAMLEEGMK